MPLSKQDRDWVKLIAKELAFKVNKETLELHINSCPYGKKLLFGKASLIGVCVAVGTLSTGVGFGLAKLIAAF